MTASLFDAPVFDAPALLCELSRRGVLLERRGDRLHLEAQPGTVGDLLPEIAASKLELLALLPLAPSFPSAEAIGRAARRILPYLAARLDAHDRHALAFALACLDCGIDPGQSEAA